jgi:hypothetical protein
LPRKCEALSSKPQYHQKRKEGRKERKKERRLRISVTYCLRKISRHWQGEITNMELGISSEGDGAGNSGKVTQLVFRTE